MAEDLRVRRTKRAIKLAFIKLVNEKGFSNVTIKEIAEEAIVNRQTFYNYYQDKYDLTEQLNDEYLAIFENLINQRIKVVQSQGRKIPLISDFYKSDDFAAILTEREAKTALLSIQYDQNSFKNRLRTLFLKIIQEQLSLNFTNLDLSIIGNFYIDTINAIVKSDVQPTEQDLAELRKFINLIIQ